MEELKWSAFLSTPNWAVPKLLPVQATEKTVSTQTLDCEEAIRH